MRLSLFIKTQKGVLRRSQNNHKYKILYLIYIALYTYTLHYTRSKIYLHFILWGLYHL